MEAMFEGPRGERLRLAILSAVVVLAVFLGVKTFGEFMNLRYVGAGVMPTNTIYVAGHGEAVAVPDIATFTYSVVSERSTVAAAQDEATTKSNEITDYLKGAGIEERDIQTTGYTVYPMYDYNQVQCISYPCPGQQTLRGYEVRQTTTIKIRNTDQAGDLLTEVGGRGATEVSGLSFTFDNPDTVKAEARDKAIADAKAKAETLSRSLGVRLVRIVSFNENDYSPMPYYARDVVYGMGGMESSAMAQSAPTISTGENKVTSDISITYEIR